MTLATKKMQQSSRKKSSKRQIEQSFELKKVIKNVIKQIPSEKLMIFCLVVAQIKNTLLYKISFYPKPNSSDRKK